MVYCPKEAFSQGLTPPIVLVLVLGAPSEAWLFSLSERN
jgi:hypothetical protein